MEAQMKILHVGSHQFRGNVNRYTKRPLQDSAIIFPFSDLGNLRFTAQIAGFPANVSNPQGGKSTDFSAGKCHLLYFVVVPESLTIPGVAPGVAPRIVGFVLLKAVGCHSENGISYSETGF